MLLVLLYHRINAVEYSNRLDIFLAHVKFIADHYPVVLPGDTLPSGKTAVCLTFDDAYFDFYHYVFPLLCELKIRALLGVPVKYIVESTTLDSISRLSIPYDEAMANEVSVKKVPFCTWDEISQMVASGFVEVASHSYSHRNLTDQDVDLREEIVRSKAILEENLPQRITTFVYPFGKVNKKVHSFVTRHYLYAMRIGSALNKDWYNSHGLIYRVNGDCLTNPLQPLKKINLSKYLFKYVMNTIRGR
ncbi:MAG: polysaccharide deacetylase family protein [Nitrospira sp.]|nr:polysaccharide deacetylase family protein [Nitrospira sp.]